MFTFVILPICKYEELHEYVNTSQLKDPRISSLLSKKSWFYFPSEIYTFAFIRGSKVLSRERTEE